MKSKKNSAGLHLLLLGFLIVGCSGGEYRAENLPSKREIQTQIDTVTASTSIPQGAKPSILAGLKSKLQRASP